jgi:hypothetical protein
MSNKTATVTIAGKQFTLTPMTIAERRRGTKLALEITEIAKKGSVDLQTAEAFLDAMLGIIHASLRRAQPITLAQIEENISQEEALRILDTLLQISVPSDFSAFGASNLHN